MALFPIKLSFELQARADSATVSILAPIVSVSAVALGVSRAETYSDLDMVEVDLTCDY